MPERTLTVKEVTGRKDVPLQHGAFVEYRFHVEEFGDEVVWLRKGSSPDAPSGQITGELTPSDHGLKFKLAPKNSGGPGGTYRPRDPSETRAIQRQHSQEMALRYAAIKASLGGVTPDQVKLDAIRPMIDWFEADISSGRGEA